VIKRFLSKELARRSRHAPVVVITGPRQSGKTTLARAFFPAKPYVSLENPDHQEFALVDPRGFLERHKDGAIFDEIQRAPRLLSYLQEKVDLDGRPGRFILTGSQQLLIAEKVTQTLAGRAAFLTLLPFQFNEIQTRMARGGIDDFLLRGFYPRLYKRSLAPRDWYPDYIRTYVERDVRLIKNITDLRAFQTFLRLCASRTGQVLNLTSVANDAGITHNTAKAWIGILEATFIVFLVSPHHRNYRKRLVKAPKLYFFDTGLACSLLGIETTRQVSTHPLRGALFETMIVAELAKQRFHGGAAPGLFHWRDQTGHEIDCLLAAGERLQAVEIKSGRTVAADWFRSLRYWAELSKSHDLNLIYGGEDRAFREGVRTVPWREVGHFALEERIQLK